MRAGPRCALRSNGVRAEPHRTRPRRRGTRDAHPFGHVPLLARRLKRLELAEPTSRVHDRYRSDWACDMLVDDLSRDTVTPACLPSPNELFEHHYVGGARVAGSDLLHGRGRPAVCLRRRFHPGRARHRHDSHRVRRSADGRRENHGGHARHRGSRCGDLDRVGPERGGSLPISPRGTARFSLTFRSVSSRAVPGPPSTWPGASAVRRTFLPMKRAT